MIFYFQLTEASTPTNGTTPISPTIRSNYIQDNYGVPGMTYAFRSAALNQSIMDEAAKLLATNTGITPMNSSYWGTHGYQGTTENVIQDGNSAPFYGGPGAWCFQGQNTSVPTTVPLPYQGAANANYGSNGTCTSNFADRFQTFKFPLPDQMDWYFTGPIQCDAAAYSHYILPISLQPNGGIQIAWKELNANIIHITYLDPYYQRVQPDITFPGFRMGGLIAFDTGSAILISQFDCDAPSTADGNAYMGRAMLLYWENGQLVYARRLTDPYRSTPQSSAYAEVKILFNLVI